MSKDFFRHLYMIYSWFNHLRHIFADLAPPPIRWLIWKLSLKKMGKNVFVDYGAYFRFPSKIEIGNEVMIGRDNSFIPAHANEENKIVIGNNVRLGPGIIFFGNSHDYSYLDLPDKGGAIYIEDHVWIGGGCRILPGVTIHEGSVVAAGSVVSKDVPPYSVVAGVPAKLIKQRIIDPETPYYRDKIAAIKSEEGV